MAAPSGTVWGATVGGYGRIGIYVGLTNTDTQTTANVEVWFWSKYSVHDINNTFCFDNLASAGSATTDRGSVSVKTTIDVGTPFPTDNQVKIASYSYTYARGTSAATRYLYASLGMIDVVGGGSTMYASKTFSVPKLATYTIAYNANGGSGAPASQTKSHGVNLTLSSTIPTRTGYSFVAWALTKEAADEGTWYYKAGSTCGRNENLTLYAVWKANTYTVRYDANGGTGAPSDQTKTYGVTLILSDIIPTRTNYNFKGWGTSASSTAVRYAPGSAYTDNAGITLYAVWELAYVKPRIEKVTVSRCLNDGSPSDDGTYASLKFDWECDKQISSITAQWVNSSGATESASIDASGTSGSVNAVVGGSFDTERLYTIEIFVRDTVGYAYTREILPGKEFPFDVLAGGKGVAFGKPAEASEVLDSAWRIKERGTLLSDKYSQKVDLHKKHNGAIQNDYCTTVIGLCSTSPASTNVNSYSIGRITLHRVNGLQNPVMVDVAMEGDYNAAYGTHASLRQLGWHKEYVPVPVTFTYNGVVYGGLKVRYADAALKYVEFHGASNFDIFAVDYYNSNTGAVLDSEIYDSITEVEHTGFDWSRLLYVSEYLKVPNVRATGNYGMHMGVANNPELAWLYQAGGSTTGSKWFSPKTDGALLLGASSYRWGQIYSTTSSISASDRNQKKDFTEFDERYEELFAKLKPQLFKFKDGTSDRKHSGFISQDVEQAMLEVGLTDKDFAGFCKDIKQIETGENKETGEVFFENVYDEHGDPVYNYSLRYEEFIALNTYIIQKQQSEIEALKNELQELKYLCSKILPQVEDTENGGNNL